MRTHALHPGSYLNRVVLDVEMAGYATQVCGVQKARPLLKTHHLGLVQLPCCRDDQVVAVALQHGVILGHRQHNTFAFSGQCLDF